MVLNQDQSPAKILKFSRQSQNLLFSYKSSRFQKLLLFLVRYCYQIKYPTTHFFQKLILAVIFQACAFHKKVFSTKFTIPPIFCV